MTALAAPMSDDPHVAEIDRIEAVRLLTYLCSDRNGITIPLRRTIEDAEAAIAKALAKARTAPRLTP